MLEARTRVLEGSSRIRERGVHLHSGRGIHGLAGGRLLADEAQARGTDNHTPVYPREVVRRALELNATALILVHNHPSGDPTPSPVVQPTPDANTIALWNFDEGAGTHATPQGIDTTIANLLTGAAWTFGPR